MRNVRSSFEERERQRRQRRLERKCRRNPLAKECILLNSVITRDFDNDETTTQPPPDDVSTVLFKGFSPATEIQTKAPKTKSSTESVSPTSTIMPNVTSIVPEQIVVSQPPLGPQQGVDGWILLVGILAGTTILVTLVWNSVKLWCRKIERQSMQRPPAITYITGDQALASRPDGNRLAEVPVDRIHEFNIELNAGGPQACSSNEIALTNTQLNRLVIAGATNSTFNLASSTTLVPPPAPATPALTQTTDIERSPPPPYPRSDDTLPPAYTQANFSANNNNNSQDNITDSNSSSSSESGQSDEPRGQPDDILESDRREERD